jgi:hypothetical protein
VSLTNLCEVKDIRNEYPDLPTSMNSKVKNKIPTATIDTYQDAKLSEDATDEMILHNLKMACVYKILIWLEGLGSIEGYNTDVSSFKDGDFAVTFKGKESSGQPTSYQGWYKYYLSKIKTPRPPVGGRNIYDRGNPI